MPKRDRNNVVLGPARLSLEDEALARARMSNARFAAVPPIPPVELPEEFIYDTGSFPVVGYPWAKLDLTAFGAYAKTLVLRDAMVNADNTAQTFVPGNWNPFPSIYGSLLNPLSPTGIARRARTPFTFRLFGNQLWMGPFYRGPGEAFWSTVPTFTSNVLPPYVFGFDFSRDRVQEGLLSAYVSKDHYYAVCQSQFPVVRQILVRMPTNAALSVEALLELPNISSPGWRVIGVYQTKVLLEQRGVSTNNLYIFDTATKTLQVVNLGSVYFQSNTQYVLQEAAPFITNSGTSVTLPTGTVVGKQTGLTRMIGYLPDGTLVFGQNTFPNIATSEALPLTIPDDRRAFVHDPAGYWVVEPAGATLKSLVSNSSESVRSVEWSPGEVGQKVQIERVLYQNFGFKHSLLRYSLAGMF